MDTLEAEKEYYSSRIEVITGKLKELEAEKGEEITKRDRLVNTKNSETEKFVAASNNIKKLNNNKFNFLSGSEKGIDTISRWYFQYLLGDADIHLNNNLLRNYENSSNISDECIDYEIAYPLLMEALNKRIQELKEQRVNSLKIIDDCDRKIDESNCAIGRINNDIDYLETEYYQLTRLLDYIKKLKRNNVLIKKRNS